MTAREIEEAQLREIAAIFQPAADTATIKAGDTAIVIVDCAEFYADHNVAAKLALGTEIKVLEIRGRWIGAAVVVDGEAKTGWIDSSKVRNQVSPEEPEGAGEGRFSRQDHRAYELVNHQMVARPWKASGN